MQQMGSAAVLRSALATACLAVALVCAGAAVSQPSVAADTYSWEPQTGEATVSITRAAPGGAITSLELSVTNAPCDDGASAAYFSPSLSKTVPVTANGEFVYDGPDESGVGASRLQISGRFTGTSVAGSFSFSGRISSGATCRTAAPIAFTAGCIDCSAQAAAGDGGSAAIGSGLAPAERFVPFQQVGRAPLGSTFASFKSRYPKALYDHALPIKPHRGLNAFFHLDPRSEPGDGHGVFLQILSDAKGRIYAESARTDDIDDARSTWLRTSGGIGIGSTLAQVRAAYPKLECGSLGPAVCSLVRRGNGSARMTLFTFDGSVRGGATSRVRGVSVMLYCSGGCKASAAPKPRSRP
jgi:hypothetical protein